MGTTIGMWICIILAVISFFGFVSAGSAILALIVPLGLCFLGLHIFNSAPDEYKKGVGMALKEEEHQKLHGGYKCPNCGMNAGHKIGAISKSVSVGAFGLASNKIGKTYKCENCKYMW